MLESLKEHIVSFSATAGIKLISSIVILIVCWKLISVLIKFLQKGKLFGKIDASAKSFLLNFLSIVLKVVLVLTVASILGVPMTNVVAVLGSCGLAIGLALQGSLSNFAGGLMILIFKPFKAGDYVEACGNAGTVQAISMLYTKLLTVDNKAIMIPNGTLSNSTVINYTAENIRRVDLTFSVAYDTDIERVKKILLVIAEQHDAVLTDPAPTARLLQQNDSSLDFTLRAWCDKEDYWDVYFDLNEGVKAAFDKVNIQIPYPQMDVHVKND